jgi:hypothetical protein
VVKWRRRVREKGGIVLEGESLGKAEGGRGEREVGGGGGKERER